MDCAYSRFGLDTARTLLTELTQLRFAQLGRPFAAARQHHSARRAEVAPDGAHCVLPTDAGWSVFETTQASPCFEWTGSERTSASFLGAGVLGVARGFELFVATPSGEGLRRVRTFERGIAGLEGLSADFILVNLLPRTIGSEDLHLFDLSADQIAEVPNIALTFEGDTARWSDGFACCGSGIQKSELRFVARNGAWTTRFGHSTSVRTLAPSPDGGCFSVDRDGLLLRWRADCEKLSGSWTLPKATSNWLLRTPTRMFAASDTQLALTHPEEGTLFVDLEDNTAQRLRANLRAAPKGCATIAPFESASGWYWVDAGAGRLCERWRLPWALATRDELAALPFVDASTLDTVLEQGLNGRRLEEALFREGWDFGVRAPSELSFDMGGHA